MNRRAKNAAPPAATSPTPAKASGTVVDPVRGSDAPSPAPGPSATLSAAESPAVPAPGDGADGSSHPTPSWSRSSPFGSSGPTLMFETYRGPHSPDPRPPRGRYRPVGLS